MGQFLKCHTTFQLGSKKKPWGLSGAIIFVKKNPIQFYNLLIKNGSPNTKNSE
uniref:Uncharacterized protein n=1 Tax=Anguilla anguilla TaxID=7936 RepID=A0A0E9QJY9_ANGAN